MNSFVVCYEHYCALYNISLICVTRREIIFLSWCLKSKIIPMGSNKQKHLLHLSDVDNEFTILRNNYFNDEIRSSIKRPFNQMRFFSSRKLKERLGWARTKDLGYFPLLSKSLRRLQTLDKIKTYHEFGVA